MMKERVRGTEVIRYEAGKRLETPDLLVMEEPLEIRLGYGPANERRQKSISVTMRTPGHDLELAVGFLFSEGILDEPEQVKSLAHCLNVEREEEVGNVVKVELQPEHRPDLDRLDRHFYTTSSCGVCGKTSIEAVTGQSCPVLLPHQPRISASFLISLPDQARAAQTVFKHTGGIHAASLFDLEGNLLAMREDVGRHNAMDKVIGAEFLAGRLPLQNRVFLASGRLSFELVQKALRAGLPVVAAVGAPSSLAIELAQSQGQTVVGFLRGERFNVYCGAERVV